MKANERKLKQLNIMTVIAVIVSTIFVLLFVFVFAPKEQNKLKPGTLKPFNDRWVLKNYSGLDDEIVELPIKVKAKDDETLVIMKKLPENVGEDTVLFFETEFQNVMVMVGERKVYSNGVMNDQKLMQNAVPCNNIVPLEGAKPGEIVAIYLASAYSKYRGQISSIYIGSRSDVFAKLIKENAVGFLFAVLLMIVTVFLVIFMFTIRSVKVDKMKASYAFGFVFAAALWSMLKNPLTQIITGNNFGVYMTSMVLLLLMPVLYVMYQRCFALKRRYAQIFEIAIYIFAINMLTGVVFQMMSVCDFATYMIFTKVLIVIALILLSGIMYLAADTYSDKSIYRNLVANAILTVACIAEAVLSLFRFYEPYDGVVLQIGIYVFVVLLMISVEKTVINEMTAQRDEALQTVEQNKSDLLSDLNTQFVYKSLNKIISDLKQKEHEESRMVYDTSMYLKYNMDSLTNQGMVSYEKELEYIRAYLFVQRKMYEGLEVSIEDKVTEFKVPFNTIEPLVENAVVNGALKAETGGRIVVRSYERLDCFAIQIVDNGKGVGPDRKFTGKQSFKTIRKRLKNQCGAVIEVNNKPEKGTIITVKIPKQGYIIKE